MKHITDSTLEDIRAWFEQGVQIGEFLAKEAGAKEAKDWNESLNDILDFFQLKICTECKCCFQKSSGNFEGMCQECIIISYEQWRDDEEMKREAYECWLKR